MANIKANITELRQLLDITPAEHNLMLVGNHGIGKSEILQTIMDLALNRRLAGRVCVMELQ